jgi:CspA family cold shock protein
MEIPIMKGTVLRIVADKGFGFIRATDGDNKEYFFHRSALKNVSFSELAEGDEVEFEDSEGEKGPRAEDIYV